jgi:cytochrome c oxidase cbb3-type subunit 4
MNIYSFLSVAATVLSFLSFLGIVAWAYSSHRRAAFEEAANAPFALPDEIDVAMGNEAERQS